MLFLSGSFHVLRSGCDAHLCVSSRKVLVRVTIALALPVDGSRENNRRLTERRRKSITLDDNVSLIIAAFDQTSPAPD